MRLALVANARMPTERAHGVQLASMCAALADRGATVELVVPARDNHLDQDVAAFYGLPRSFAVRRLPTLDLVSHGRAGARIQRGSFVAAAVADLAARPPSLVVTRDELVAALLAPRLRTVYECHRFPGRALPVWGRLVRRAHGVVSTNRWKADVLVDRLGVDPARVTVLPNGTEVDAVHGAAPRAALRAELGLADDVRLVVYVGHLYGWKGVEALTACAPLLPVDTHLVLVGGTDRDLARFRRIHQHPRLHLVGRVPHVDVAGYLRAADLLVLPNAASTRESRMETSPLKLFEYMASGRPIVASDLPAVREIVGEDAALLVAPDDTPALATGITALLDDPARARQLADTAFQRVQDHTWDRRAEALLRFAGALPPR